jgi:hypothetical protein
MAMSSAGFPSFFHGPLMRPCLIDWFQPSTCDSLGCAESKALRILFSELMVTGSDISLERDFDFFSDTLRMSEG